jgi:hypothetical protein
MKQKGLLYLVRLAVRLARQQLRAYVSKFPPRWRTQPSLLACLCFKNF